MTEQIEETDNTLTEEERKERHRDQAKRFERARYNATRRLIEAHKAEYAMYHDEEKTAQGIQSRHAGALARVRQLFERYPELKDLLTPKQAEELTAKHGQAWAYDEIMRRQVQQIQKGAPPVEDAADPLAK